MTGDLTVDVDEILDRAADIIDTHGWTWGQFRAGTGEVCLRGAINLAVFPNNNGLLPGGMTKEFEQHNQRLNALRALAVLGLSLDTKVAHWNDHKCRGQDHAADVLRQAAKHYREENSR